MEAIQRRITLVFMAVTMVALVVIIGFDLQAGVDRSAILFTAAGLVLQGLLFVLYWRGWDYARLITVLVAASLMPLSLPLDLLVSDANVAVLIPPILALVLTGPAAIIASGVVVLAALLYRSGGNGAWLLPQNIASFSLCVAGLVFARMLLDGALRRAEANAATAQVARTQAEAQAADLAAQTQVLHERNVSQQELLALVATLETPAVPLMDGVLLVPLVGHLDLRRIDALTNRVLQTAHLQGARLVILDLAGTPQLDPVVARQLLQTAQALRLIGCEVSISGLSAALALTMTQLGISFNDTNVVRSPQVALAHYATGAAL